MKQVESEIDFKKPIKSTDFDTSFKYEVANTYEGRTVLYCYQCGVCSAGCPVLGALEYMPHQIIRMVNLGLREEVLQSTTIWMCATCYLCNERCPQGVDVSNVFYVLKNMAAREGIIPKGLKQFARTLYKLGVTAEVTDFQEEEREDLGLAEVPEIDSRAIKEILKKTGLFDILKNDDNEKEDET
ncbi:MAG: 4Fe-4S dicluster domain-containing protein [Candidatus Helarchaeota archaeon]